MEQKKLESVRVRMYCQGFGDCFLVTFRYGKKPENKHDPPQDLVHLMFDFGVWKDEKNRMEAIAENFLTETGGKLDVLVITHEHKDHLSGFYGGMREQFMARQEKKLIIDRLWLAWTEDLENNPLAKELHGRFNVARHALRATRDKLASLYEQTTGDAQPVFGMDEARRLQTELLDLEEGGDSDEPDPEDTGAMGLNGRAETEKPKRMSNNKAALKWLKENARQVVYFKPGQRIANVPNALPEGLQEVQLYVLGPPESVQALKKNESAKEGDLYLSENYISDSFSIGSVRHNSEFENYTDWINQTPFEDEYCCPMRFEADEQTDLTLTGINRDTNAMNKRTAYLKECAVYKNYLFLEQEAFYWKKEDGKEGLDEVNFQRDRMFAPRRRIDYEWLRASQSLALDMNSHTNNTSLVLAIEIDKTKQVLLFPGDAQFGNWNSWFENQYEWQFDKKENEPKRTVTVEDLLERTVFYKVSHHGSHNATPQDRGLKLMTRTDLVAMVPVSRTIAQSNDWPIPYDKLMREFDSRPVTYVLSDKPGETRGNPHAKVFKPDKNGLYVDYEITL